MKLNPRPISFKTAIRNIIKANIKSRIERPGDVMCEGGFLIQALSLAPVYRLHICDVSEYYSAAVRRATKRHMTPEQIKAIQ